MSTPDELAVRRELPSRFLAAADGEVVVDSAPVAARVAAAAPADGEPNPRDYADQLRAMQRHATRPGGLRGLLRWLARRATGRVMLLDDTGAVLMRADPPTPPPGLPEDVLGHAAEAIERVASGAAGSAAVNLESAGTAHISWIGEERPGAVLVVARDEPFPAVVRSLIGDAARLLWLRWRLDDLAARRRRVDQAEAHAREAVLQLLMVGDLQGARRAAGAFGPRLADQIRVYVVESPPGTRQEVMDRSDRAADGRAWIVPCPVYTHHLIVLAPVPREGAVERALRSLAAAATGVAVGASETVPLRETASGYEQAFHALAVGSGSSRRFASFTPRGDLAALLRPSGSGWANDTLEPLLRHQPDRCRDPDGAELTATLASWLDFYGGAARQLKIHRNTQLARLRHVERLLGLGLDDVATQARLDLALRILRGPRGRGPVEPTSTRRASLEGLLDAPEMRGWAEAQLFPLLTRDPELFLRTLRTWLANNARMEATATALGISVPGARKRLVRIEEALERSLLNGPSARYDLWFAVRVYDATGALEARSRRSSPSDETRM